MFAYRVPNANDYRNTPIMENTEAHASRLDEVELRDLVTSLKRDQKRIQNRSVIPYRAFLRKN